MWGNKKPKKYDKFDKFDRIDAESDEELDYEDDKLLIDLNATSDLDDPMNTEEPTKQTAAKHFQVPETPHQNLEPPVYRSANVIKSESEDDTVEKILKEPMKRFQTVEQANKIKVVPQQWRLKKENVISRRPKHMPYLMPIDSQVTFPVVPPIRSGRVHKRRHRQRKPEGGSGKDKQNMGRSLANKQLVDKGNMIYQCTSSGKVLGIATKKKNRQECFSESGESSSTMENFLIDFNDNSSQIPPPFQFTPSQVLMQPSPITHDLIDFQENPIQMPDLTSTMKMLDKNRKVESSVRNPALKSLKNILIRFFLF